MCNARYIFTAVSCIAPGSTNDRQAWTLAGFDEAVAALPDPYFVVGDAAYRASEKMLVPYPGTNLDSSRDTFNYYQSQARMPIEQAFGILVSVEIGTLLCWYFSRVSVSQRIGAVGLTLDNIWVV